MPRPRSPGRRSTSQTMAGKVRKHHRRPCTGRRQYGAVRSASPCALSLLAASQPTACAFQAAAPPPPPPPPPQALPRRCQGATHQGHGRVEACRAHQHKAAQAVRLPPHAAHHRIHEQRGGAQAVPNGLQPVGQHLLVAGGRPRCAAWRCRRACSGVPGTGAAFAAYSGAAVRCLLSHAACVDWHRHMPCLPAVMLQWVQGRLAAAQRGDASAHRCMRRLHRLLHYAMPPTPPLPPVQLLLALLLLRAATAAAGIHWTTAVGLRCGPQRRRSPRRRRRCQARSGAARLIVTLLLMLLPPLRPTRRPLFQVHPAPHVHPAQCVQHRVGGGPAQRRRRLLGALLSGCCVAPSGGRQLSHLSVVDVGYGCTQTAQVGAQASKGRTIEQKRAKG